MKRMHLPLAICLFLLTSNLFSQHIHLQHPESGHAHAGSAIEYARHELSPGPTNPFVNPASPIWELVYNISYANTMCEPAPWTVTFTSTQTHTCGVTWGGNMGGSVETAAGALWWNLKGEAHAQVDWHHTGTSTNTISISHEFPTIVPPCKRTRFQYRRLRADVTGSFATYDHKIVCHEVLNGQPWVTFYCNPTNISGSATGFCDEEAKFSRDGEVEGCDCGDDEIDPDIIDLIDELIDIHLQEFEEAGATDSEIVEETIDQIELHELEVSDDQ